MVTGAWSAAATESRRAKAVMRAMVLNRVCAKLGWKTRRTHQPIRRTPGVNSELEPTPSTVTPVLAARHECDGLPREHP